MTRRFATLAATASIVCAASTPTIAIAADAVLKPYLIAPENVVIDLPTGQCSMTTDRQQRGARTVESVVIEPSDKAQTLRPTVRVVRFGSTVSREDQARALAQSAARQKAAIEALGGKLVHERDITLGEQTGKELLMAMNAEGSQLYRVRNYYVGSTQLMVSARGTKQQITTGAYEKLFGSIRMAKPEEARRAVVRCKEAR